MFSPDCFFQFLCASPVPFLLHDGHGHSCPGVRHILSLPQLGHRLDLGVKLDSLLAVKVGVPSERATGTGEGEHREGDGDGDVDTNLQERGQNPTIIRWMESFLIP